MNSIRTAAVTAICMILSAFAQAEKLTFVTTEFPPYIIKQGEVVSGIEVDEVRELCKRVGVEPEIIVMPWNRALAYVKSGQAEAIFMPVFSKERAEYMYYTEEPSGHERISLMALKGAGVHASSLDNVKNELVGVVLGYSYGKEFDENTAIQRDVSMDNEQLLKKLKLRRYQLLVSDETVIRYVAKQSGSVELETVLNLTDNPQYVGFSKTLGARGQELAKRFSQAIREMRQDGSLAKIEGQYF
ncbi:MAG: transporter substrate-binding domain-containing protein [Burkholderiales bacterium]|nr:transporter substrate-binding domain-containing protein [Burkholderiales bacterium]